MNDNKFKTSDLYFAAYLKASQVPLLETERKDRQVIFVFDNSLNMIKDLKTQYYNRTSKLPALTYADEIRSMKSLTHEILAG
jgi:hypothetical protein